MNATQEPIEPGSLASEAIDRKLRDWRNAPTTAPVPLELHLLRTAIADFVDRERVGGKSYAEAHAALLAVVSELPAPNPPEAGEAAVEALKAVLDVIPTTEEPEAPKRGKKAA